jgi:HEAT repeat protein
LLNTLEIGAETEHFRQAFEHHDLYVRLAQIKYLGELFDQAVVNGVVSFRPVNLNEADVILKPDFKGLIGLRIA